MKMLRASNSADASDALYSLACGPDRRVSRYTGCIVNGIRFHTEEREKYRTTQNSGVVVKGTHEEVEIDFYGVLTDIIELSYCMRKRVYLFKCDWWDIGNKKLGIQTDNYFTSVNLSRKWFKDDPFIIAGQAEQVFYLADTKLGGSWHVVQKIKPRNIFDVPEVDVEDNDEGSNRTSSVEQAYQEDMPSWDRGNDPNVDIDVVQLNRDDVPPDHVDASIINDIVRDDSAFIDDNVADDEEEILISDSDGEEERVLSDNDSDDDY